MFNIIIPKDDDELYMTENLLFITDFNKDNFTAAYQDEFYQYWLKLKGNRVMPSRSDIDPNDMVKYLSRIILADYHIEEDEFTFRLIGTKCMEVGGEIFGKTIKSDNEMSRFYGRFKWCVDHKKPYFIETDLEVFNKNYIRYSTIVCPLSNDDQNVNMLILVSHFF